MSLKLIKQLKEQSSQSGTGINGRTFREVTLSEPIRYAAGSHLTITQTLSHTIKYSLHNMIEINRDWMSVGDSVEAWLNNLLCLDATTVKPLGIGCPHPEECDL